MKADNRQRRLSEDARKTHKAPLDAKYNRGRKDCIEGNIYSDDAKYFLMCENKE